MAGRRKSCRLDDLNGRRWHLKSPAEVNRGINATTIMKRKHTHAMTLRLDPRLHGLLTDASYDARLSRAAFIRRAIHAHLGQRRREEPAMQEPVLR